MRDPGFDIDQLAQKAFGTFQNDAEYGEVVWKFKPSAAPYARAFLFHPNQMLEDRPDGSLIVRFSASGHLEMCWHLYMWGDQVEVLARTPFEEWLSPINDQIFMLYRDANVLQGYGRRPFDRSC